MNDAPAGMEEGRDVSDQQQPTLPPDLEPALSAFAQAYIRRVPDEHVSQRSDEDVFAELRNFFDFVVARRPGEIAVRVFNPSRSADGYDPGRTVVDVAVDDSRFLVDSTRAAIEAEGHTITLDVHTVIGTERSREGDLLDIGHVRTSTSHESVQHYVLERALNKEDREALKAKLVSVLEDVHLAVRDFEPMRDEVVDRMIQLTRRGISRYSQDEVWEGIEFLRWLRDDNFVFLGYREYEIVDDSGEPALVVVEDSGRGMLSNESKSKHAEPIRLADLPEDLQERYAEGFLVVVAKTNRASTVHRPARMDYVGIRIVGPDGEVVGEARLVGLFTSRALMSESATIPILRNKLKAVVEAEDLFEGSHDHRAVVQMFNSFPKAELWSMPVESLRLAIQGLLDVDREENTRLFVSPDLLSRNVSVLVRLPRDRFNARLRLQMQDMFLERFGGKSVDYQLTLGEAGDARVHFTVWIGEGQVPEVPFEELQHAVVEMSRTWDDRIGDVLAETTDDGKRLVGRWSPRLPEYYKASTPMSIAAGDILQLQALEESGSVQAVGLQNEDEGDNPLTRVGVYARNGKLELSHILPVLEALGLRVIEEVPTRVEARDGEIFIHDIGVLAPGGEQLHLGWHGPRVVEAIAAGLRRTDEPDSLDRLITLCSLDHKQVEILRAYRTYRRRVSTGFTVGYVNDTLAKHAHVAEKLVKLFEARFDPASPDADAEDLIADIRGDLDSVRSLDEDRILRGFLRLILATVRTNAYVPRRKSLSFKLRSVDVPDMPKPTPLFEIFVYAPHVEGIHLRGGMVARGGIRWSDRREDYRDEVLGLMKAQMTKNAVIVPTGAKGGFVLRTPPQDGDVRAAVTFAYQTFIRGLLDVTDNLVEERIVPPSDVVRHDGDDPYLVVAADRGTAALSDTANVLSGEYGFWLRDAFASGGSVGYDHKKLAITARGAWESVRQHFLDVSVDVDNSSLTAVGIGDMSGDVFGNGMLRSRNLRLVAAFDHRDIFIDPDPDGAGGFKERQRLFDLPGSSWQDYDRSLISEGGGVWSRSEKAIQLSEEARAALSVDDVQFTPHELISAILKAPVDLLWNGGIGTYVKASWESHVDCQDRANDALRVNADELRCLVVGEGGNLGFTQSGRIEYARSGGRINTDFIDNSGGVDCSDREVNLKILLALAEERGALDSGERSDLIAAVTEGVTDRVLHGNREQAQILSQDEEWSASNLEAFEDLMNTLERHELLDRDLEGLPTTDDLAERARDNLGLTRPELSVLLAYAKQDLTNALLESDVPDQPDVLPDLSSYFPDDIADRFAELLPDHPLRREILATVLANRALNDQGITFVNRLVLETGATRAEVVPAYRLAHLLIDADARWESVDQLDADVDPALRRELLDSIDWLVESVTRWLLALPEGLPSTEQTEVSREAFAELEACFAETDFVRLREERGPQIEDLVAEGIPLDVATRHAYHDELVHAPDIIQIANRSGRTVREVAEVFIHVGHRYQLDWLEGQIGELSASTRWNRWAIRSLESDLVHLRRDIAEKVVAEADGLGPESALDAYAQARAERHARLEQFMQLLSQEGTSDLDALMVTAQQIRALTR